MIIYKEKINVISQGMRPTFHNITEQAKKAVATSGVKDGIFLVYTHHTTCSVMIQECSFDVTYNGLEFLQQDLIDVFENIIPTCRKEGQYMHPGPKATEFALKNDESKAEALNTDAHIRSSLIGRSESIVISDGILDLGKFGQIYFVDFDQTRSRKREVRFHIMGE